MVPASCAGPMPSHGEHGRQGRRQIVIGGFVEACTSENLLGGGRVGVDGAEEDGGGADEDDCAGEDDDKVDGDGGCWKSCRLR